MTAPKTPEKPAPKNIPVPDVLPLYDLGAKVARSTVAVIDIVVSRGAIKGEELSTIGELRDNSIKLIQACENFHSSLEDL